MLIFSYDVKLQLLNEVRKCFSEGIQKGVIVGVWNLLEELVGSRLVVVEVVWDYLIEADFNLLGRRQLLIEVYFVFCRRSPICPLFSRESLIESVGHGHDLRSSWVEAFRYLHLKLDARSKGRLRSSGFRGIDIERWRVERESVIDHLTFS